LREKAMEALQLLPHAPAELANAIRAVESISSLADIVASFMDLKTADKQDILATFDLKTRLDRVLTLLNRRIEVLKVSRQIDEKTREAFDGRQKEAVLRERLRQIQKELGETDSSGAELEELKKAIAEAGMPAEAEEQALRELARLERMSDGAAEYSMTRTYLDWLIAMPWSKIDAEQLDMDRARAILDEDHYGLEKVKKRILEFLAVRKLNPEGRSPILCFVGPPGVGKTSLGQSIAKALGLQFRRVSLGGVHDEAEIRGHRRTYIGSLPGNIVQAMRKAGRRNPVLMLDEVDKLSASHQGDPFSALLEVLDPEQNNSFRDNYLGVPFDLSKVAVHRHRQCARRYSGAAARSNGGHRTHRLHRRGEAANRPALPVEASVDRKRPVRRPGAGYRGGAAQGHRRSHARGWRQKSRSAKSAPCCAMRRSPSPPDSPRTSLSMLRRSRRSSGLRASRTTSRCAPASPESPPDWHGLPRAATSCSSNRAG